MLISIILLLLIFVGMLVLIAIDVMERAALVFICAVATFFVLIFVEHAPPTVIIDFLFGTTEDGYVNFRTTMLVFGIMIISTICNYTGFFQFIAFKLIKSSKGDPKKVLVITAMMAFLISSVLADSITVLIIIPLTITVCRALRMNPVPFLIIQAIYIKLGAVILPISSIPAILITSSQEISFAEYFLTSGLTAIIMSMFSLLIFYTFYKDKLPTKQVEGLEIFIEYNPWIFVKDRRLMIVSAITFVSVIIGLVVIPPSILGMDAIACLGAAFLLIMTRKHAQEILKQTDFNLLLYLFGVFIVSGALQYVGFIDIIGSALSSLGITDIGLAFLALMWIGAIASAFIDNIPITQLLLSLINILLGAKGTPNAKLGSLGLSLGITWGDNLTPFGDSILTLNVAKANNINIPPKELFKIGFPLTMFQMTTISIVVLSIFHPLVGIELLIVYVLILLFFIMRNKKKQKRKENQSK